MVHARRSLLTVGLLAAAVLALHAPAASAATAGKSVAGGYYPPSTLAPGTTYIDHPNTSCSASLIAPQRVLTAAHCLLPNDTNPDDWTARVGARDYAISSSGETKAVNGLVIHPQYSAPESGIHIHHAFYDLAVLFLSRPSNVPPIQLGTAADWGTTATALGWGHIGYDHVNTVDDSKLKAVNLSLGTDEQCLFWTNDANGQHYYSDIHICAYDYEGNDCTTHGDSGGPLVVNSGGVQKQIGILSFYPRGTGWGPCGNVSMAGFTWVGGPAINPWPLSVENPACPRAKKRFRKVKRNWYKSSKTFKKAKRNKRFACQA